MLLGCLSRRHLKLAGNSPSPEGPSTFSSASLSCCSPEDKEESIEYAGQKFWDGELPQHPRKWMKRGLRGARNVGVVRANRDFG